MENEKSPPREIELTQANYSKWPNWKKLVAEGKVIIDARGKLRYPYGAPVGSGSVITVFELVCGF